jgi:hypothetical protein
VDDIKDVGIDYTFERQYLSVHQHAGVVELNGAVYFENTTQWLARLRTVLGLREDWFRFDVKDKMPNPEGTFNIESDPLGCNTGEVHARRYAVLLSGAQSRNAASYRLRPSTYTGQPSQVVKYLSHDHWIFHS